VVDLRKQLFVIVVALGAFGGQALAGLPNLGGNPNSIPASTVAGKYSAEQTNPSGFYRFIELRADGSYSANLASGKVEQGTFALTREERGSLSWTVIEFDGQEPNHSRTFSYSLENGRLTLDTRTNPFTLPDSLIFEFDRTED
jgi:hypothetical protein